MYISHRKEFLNLTSRALALRQSKPELLVSFHASEQGSLTFLALKLTCSRLFQSAYCHFPDSVFNIKLHSLHKKKWLSKLSLKQTTKYEKKKHSFVLYVLGISNSYQPCYNLKMIWTLLKLSFSLHDFTFTFNHSFRS